MSTSFEIVGIDHVQLAMPAGQEEIARQFYGALLGFHEVHKPDSLANRGGVWFENGAVKLHLGIEPDFRPTKKAHPAFVVRNLSALVVRLEVAGVTIAVGEPVAGSNRVHALDPFGNRIELLEIVFADAGLLIARISDEHFLKLPSPADADELFRLTDTNRAYLRQWLPWIDNATCPDDTRRVIETGLRQFANRQGFHACIFFRSEIVGVVGFHAIDWAHRSTSIGYWLSESHQRQGLMTASCRAVIDYAYREWDLNRIVIRCAAGNTRSQAIPKRLGFTQEGIQREAEWLYDHFVDLINYSLLRSEWNLPDA